MAKHRDRLYEMMEQGALDPQTLARDLLGYLSDDECKNFAEQNDIQLFEDEDEFEFSDDDEVNEAFDEEWEAACDADKSLRTDKPAKRQAFSMFIDALHRDGRISDELVQSVTLDE